MSFFSLKSHLFAAVRQHHLAVRMVGAGITTLALSLTVIGLLTATPPRTYATDFGGNQSGTLVAADHVFRFLNTIAGVFTVQGTNGTKLDFSAITSSGITLDLTNESTSQVIGAASILFQGFNTAGNKYVVIGTGLDDNITGGPGNDTINGGAGIDTINGGAGIDTINGGAGIDTINGGDGNDTINGGDGNDDINGAAGNDQIKGDAGDDWINGGANDDTLNGGAGGDVIHGEDGNDTINGGDSGDTLYGEGGNDKVYGGTGNDTIYAGRDNDTISGDAGDDNLRGNAGDDTISGGAGSDTLNGGDDNDTTTDCVGDTLTDVEVDHCTEVPALVIPAPVEVRNNVPELCVTRGTRMAFEAKRNLIVIYSNFEESNPNGMLITEIPLSAIPAPSDEQKASGQPIALVYKDSEFAPGWSVGLYWHNNHYGVIVYSDHGNNKFDDTGAICGWF